MASFDNIFTIALLFGLAVAFLTGIVLWNTMTSPELVDTLWSQSSVGAGIQANGQSFYDNLDATYVLIYFALHLGILILAFVLRTHPIVYVASLLIICVMMVLAAPLSNTYGSIETSSVFSEASATLPMTSYIMDKLPVLELLFGFLSATILAGMARSEGLI